MALTTNLHDWRLVPIGLLAKALKRNISRFIQPRLLLAVAAIAAEGKIFVAGNEVVLPEGTVETTVFNLNGAVVAHAESTATMSISTVQPGVYVVKAVKADGTVVTAKIVK